METNVLENSVGYELKRAQHALRLRVDEALKRVGLTTPQYAALSVLEASPGISGAELARRSFVTPQTMNAIVSKLESASLISRVADPTHGRVLQAYVAEEGKKLLSGAHRSVRNVEDHMLAGLNAAEKQRLLEALRRCTGSLEE
ncbi:MarR family transcriptional regulator [soil metagenome]